MTDVVRIISGETEIMAARAAVEILSRGGVAAGPTQTFYALMAAYDQPEALARVAGLKGRPVDSPFLLLLDDPRRIEDYVTYISSEAELMADKYWPGPLTLLYPASPGLDPRLVGPGGTVGLRVEGLPVIRNIARELGRAVTGTSANPTGRPPAQTAGQVIDYFGDKIDLVLDAGGCPGGRPSTLVDASQSPPRLVRNGAVPFQALKSLIPSLIYENR